MDKKSPSPFIRGKIHLYQPEEGYRFNLDSVLLANFINVKDKGNLIDLGTGAGILILLLSLKYKNLKYWAVEVQDELYNLAKENFKINNLEVNLIKGNIKDLKKSLKPNTFDYVITNPPYFKEYKGKYKSLKIAKSEYLAKVEDFIDIAKYLLKDKGKLFLVFPSSRLSEIAFYLKSKKLEPKKWRIIYPSLEESATNFLVKAIKNAKEGGEIIEKPLIVYKDTQKKEYTNEVNFILEKFVE